MNIFLMGTIVGAAIISIYLELKSPSYSKGDICKVISASVIGILLLSEQPRCHDIAIICIVPHTVASLFNLWRYI